MMDLKSHQNSLITCGNQCLSGTIEQAPKIPVLQEHLTHVKKVYEEDLVDGWGRVELLGALERKYPNASQNGAGNGSFPRKTAGRTDPPGKKDVIMFSKHWFKKQSGRQFSELVL
ncbi:hypothetical protein [Desulfuromusa kysingii]|uniref:hypothetical protein n=1 Tax=Desulfuromusa kysingii TaxID=37625 RepID=UPI0031844050